MSNRRSSASPKTVRQIGARSSEDGFTLIEVMIALAILGTSLFVLLDMHYNAVQVQTRLDNEVRVRNLLSLASGISEVEVAAGNLSGSEEFGDRYPGWGYSFDAEEFDSSSSSSSSSNTVSPAFPGLYYVVVKVHDADKVEYNLEYYTVVRTQVTAQGNPDDDDDTGGTGSGGPGSGGTGSGGAGGGGTGGGGIGSGGGGN
ncbi:MAG: prepilin-type N-terminal cleavage/methylation domain-containing protein [Candidatus Hydrogenedentes bacterium]|nr:prepilin-type N-terminal cleavage/methylation domain-containing protein [Candidatus Hydrogenedentota bacterium]